MYWLGTYPSREASSPYMRGGSSVVIDRIYYTAMSGYPTRAVLINGTEADEYVAVEAATRDTRSNGAGFAWNERMNVVAHFPGDEERAAKQHTWALNQFKELSEAQLFIAPEALTRAQRLTILKGVRDSRQDGKTPWSANTASSMKLRIATFKQNSLSSLLSLVIRGWVSL